MAAARKSRKGVAHLMPVKKPTTGGWEQVYWVKASDVVPMVRAAMKTALSTQWEDFVQNPKIEKWQSVAEELGGNATIANYWITGWAGSSRHPTAAGLRGAVATLLVPEKEREAALAEEVEDILTAQTGLKKKIRERLREIGMMKDEGMEAIVDKAVRAGNTNEGRRTVQALAAMSQSMHEEETLTLYRGIYGVQGAEMAMYTQHGREVELEVGVLTAASESEAEARKAVKAFGDGKGVVLKIQVPRSAVILSHRAMPHLGPKQVKIGKEVSFATKGQLRVRAEDVSVVK